MTETRVGRHGWTRRRALRSLAAASAAASVPALTACVQREPLLRLASNVWPGYELMHAAQALGRFDESRLRIVEMPSSTDVLQAFASGAIEGGGLTLDELLSARADGLDIGAVLVFDESQGADALLARPEIATLAALAGRRIGVEQTAVGALVLNAALQSAGLRLDQVQPVILTVADHLAAWRAHEVDAVVTFEPVLGALAAEGARRLFDSRAMPGAIIDLLVVNQAAARRSPQALRHLLQVHFEMLAQWKSEPQSLAPAIGARTGLPPAQVAAAFGQIALPDLAANHAWLGGTRPRLSDSALRLLQVMQQARLLDKAPSLADLGNPAFLPVLPARPDGAGT